jgi:hypothetical protein
MCYLQLAGVTKAGLAELKRILDKHTDNAQAGLRLTEDHSGKLGLTIDVEIAEDQVFRA